MSYNQNTLFNKQILAGYIFATDYRNLESDDCKCNCDCILPDNNNSNNNNNYGGNSTKQPRYFTDWFANSKPDAQGNSVITPILKIFKTISKDQSDKWLEDLTNAAKAFPDFCNSGNEQKDKQEFATFLTNIGAETQFNPANRFPCTKQDLCPRIKEFRCLDCGACSYNSQGNQCNKYPKLQYYGRGPLLLYQVFDYNNFSQYYFKDGRALTNPDIATQDKRTCWASAIWFWMTFQNYGSWCMPQADWLDRDNCAQSCPNGLFACSNSSCTSNHWLHTGKASPHDAKQTGKGIGQTKHGHTLRKIEWLGKILQLQGEPLLYSNLSLVPIEHFSATQEVIDDKRLAGR
ncbi:hypothetical protein ABPG72_001761 [Tetrahymena utriculariae]